MEIEEETLKGITGLFKSQPAKKLDIIEFYKYGRDIYGVLLVLKEFEQKGEKVFTNYEGAVLNSGDLEAAIRHINEKLGMSLTMDVFENPDAYRSKAKEEMKGIISYPVASDLHETWKMSRRKEDGTYEPKMEKTKDENWIKNHGTDEVDVANTMFEELPSDLQNEDLKTARVIIDEMWDMTGSLEPEQQEQESTKLYDVWNQHHENSDLTKLPYEELSEKEKSIYRDLIEDIYYDHLSVCDDIKVMDYRSLTGAAKQFGITTQYIPNPEAQKEQTKGNRNINPEFTPKEMFTISDLISLFERQVREDLTRDDKETDVKEQEDESK